MYQGFGELRLPADLLRKLKHDLERMKMAPQNQYAAFDFFVTAEHIVDWIHPNNKAARELLRSNAALLRITSHIANGAKHFEAKAKRHNSISAIAKDRYVQAGYVEEGYFEEPLLIHLTPEEAKFLNTAIQIDATLLAGLVLEYWSKNLDREQKTSSF
jgi:hypothetical protein